MGTSINQSSPKTNNWNRVFPCYSDSQIQAYRIINEIWRASEKQDSPISNDIKSEAVYFCYLAVESSNNYTQALNKVNEHVLEKGNNTIIVEFAKRSIPQAFKSSSPAQEWKNLLFSEITNYVISRDASGFVGENQRNKSVSDLINYKKQITNKVKEKMRHQEREIKSQNDWDVFVDKSIYFLRNNKEWE